MDVIIVGLLGVGLALLLMWIFPFRDDTVGADTATQERLDHLLRTGDLYLSNGKVRCDYCGDGCGQCSNTRAWTEAQQLAEKLHSTRLGDSHA